MTRYEPCDVCGTTDADRDELKTLRARLAAAEAREVALRSVLALAEVRLRTYQYGQAEALAARAALAAPAGDGALREFGLRCVKVAWAGEQLPTAEAVVDAVRGGG